MIRAFSRSSSSRPTASRRKASGRQRPNPRLDGEVAAESGGGAGPSWTCCCERVLDKAIPCRKLSFLSPAAPARSGSSRRTATKAVCRKAWFPSSIRRRVKGTTVSFLLVSSSVPTSPASSVKAVLGTCTSLMRQDRSCGHRANGIRGGLDHASRSRSPDSKTSHWLHPLFFRLSDTCIHAAPFGSQSGYEVGLGIDKFQSV